MVFLQETELCERSIRRLAESRNCLVTKNGSEYEVTSADLSGILFSDDEVWEVLSAMPQTHTRGGRNRRLV